MLIAAFGPSTGWNGKTVTYENGTFALQDHGPMTAREVLEYDRRDHLRWAYVGAHEFVQQQAKLDFVGPPSEPTSGPTACVGFGVLVSLAIGITASDLILGLFGVSQSTTGGLVLIVLVGIVASLLPWQFIAPFCHRSRLRREYAWRRDRALMYGRYAIAKRREHEDVAGLISWVVENSEEDYRRELRVEAYRQPPPSAKSPFSARWKP